MALIDELSLRIATELHRKLDEAVREAVESSVVGNGTHAVSASAQRRGRPRQIKSAATSREKRSRIIIDAVAKLGEATVEEVARATGLDKRGVGSSLHYLAESGKLRHAGAGKYRAVRMARAA